ncbi:MAG: hypothetical protein WB689_30390 [Xanthobacteraceae bacterium]
MSENDAMSDGGLIERRDTPPFGLTFCSDFVVVRARQRQRKPKAQQVKAKSPLFASDDVIGAALLGADRVQEWKQMAPLLEARGLPKIDHLMGGRYVRAVVAFFDHQYGLDHGGDVPLAPDGNEDFEGWKRKQKHRA